MASDGGNQVPQMGSPDSSFTIDEIRPPEPSRARETGIGMLFCTRMTSAQYQNFLQLYGIGMLFCIYMGVGTICFYLVRHQISGNKTNSVVDAFYFTLVLVSSVGYGDLSPDSTLAILLASLFAILGTIFTGLLVSTGAQLYIQGLKNERVVDHTAENGMPKERESINMILMGITVVMALVIFMVAGMAMLVFHEKLDFIHALYCIIGTISNVGTKKCFSTKGGRIFAVFWIVYSYASLALLVYDFVELHTQRKKKSLEIRVLERNTTPADFHAADLDGDGILVISEYTLYKLRQMGKISQEDMAPIMEDFRKRDVNNKGGLTLHDITSYQSSSV